MIVLINCDCILIWLNHLIEPTGPMFILKPVQLCTNEHVSYLIRFLTNGAHLYPDLRFNLQYILTFVKNLIKSIIKCMSTSNVQSVLYLIAFDFVSKNYQDIHSRSKDCYEFESVSMLVYRWPTNWANHYNYHSQRARKCLPLTTNDFLKDDQTGFFLSKNNFLSMHIINKKASDLSTSNRRNMSKLRESYQVKLTIENESVRFDEYYEPNHHSNTMTQSAGVYIDQLIFKPQQVVKQI